VAEKILSLLEAAGIKAEGTKRGVDHGVFAPFTCMFHPDENPLGVPLVQVSLFDNEDADQHFALGAALRSLRDEGVVIVGSGMAVHNLPDFRRALMSGAVMPYAKVFDEELRKAVVDVADGEDRRRKLGELLRSKTARQAHPSFEHLLPVHIAAGAAGDDSATRLFTLAELSISWAQFRFGDVSAVQ
jgi:4,5-DOPA dioxygenase extradiol